MGCHVPPVTGFDGTALQVSPLGESAASVASLYADNRVCMQFLFNSYMISSGVRQCRSNRRDHDRDCSCGGKRRLRANYRRRRRRRRWRRRRGRGRWQRRRRVGENGASVPVVVATSGDYEMIDGSDDDDPDADDDTGMEHYPTGIIKLNLEKTFER